MATTQRNFTRRPESVMRWTMLMSSTSSSSPGRSWSTSSGSFSGSPEFSAASIVSMSPSATLRPSRVWGSQPLCSLMLFVLLEVLEHVVEVLGQFGGVEVPAVQRLVQLFSVVGDVLAAVARPVRHHALVVGDVEASVDCTFLYRERLAAGRRRVEADVEHGLVEALLGRALPQQVAGEVRARKVARRGFPAVFFQVARMGARQRIVAVGAHRDQLRPDVLVALASDQAGLARFQQAQPLMVVGPDLAAAPHWHLVS